MEEKIDSSKKEALLKLRAERLAKPKEHEWKEGHYLQLLEFKLSNLSYAIELCYVQEIHKVKEIASLPTVPSFVLGVINVRRRIFSVVDLSMLLDVPKAKDNFGNTAVILGYQQICFAILADDVVGVKEIQLEQVQPPLATLSGMPQDFLKGVTEEGIGILDGKKILCEPRLVIEESV